MTGAELPGAAIEADDVLDGVVIDLGGVALALRAEDPARAEAVASLFRHASRSSAPAVATVDFVVDDVALPQEPPTLTVPNAELWYPTAGGLFVRSGDGLTASADRDAVVIGGTCNGLAREFRFVCLNALAPLLSRCGWHLLHGAALGTADGAVVVLGETGAGKSTLAFAALRNGWPVLADDAVLLARRDDRVVVRGFPRPIAVPADVISSAAGTGTDGGRPVPDDPRRRTELASGTLTGGDRTVVAVLVAGGAVTARAGASRIERVSAQEAFLSVLRASASLADPAQRPELFPIAGALARLPAWSLGHTPDASDALDAASRILRTVATALRSQGDPSPRLVD